MKAKLSGYTIFLTFILILFPFSTKDIEMDYYEIVTKSFQATNAEKSALIIKGWAKISLRDLNEKEINEVIQKCSHRLNLPHSITVQNFDNWTNPQKGAYLEIVVKLKGNYQYSKDCYQEMRDIFSVYPDSQLGISIMGTYPGKISMNEAQDIISKAFRSVGAYYVEGLSTENLVSTSGYSPDYSNYLMIAGEKINLNIALRYHILDNNSYLSIGAPLIFQEY